MPSSRAKTWRTWCHAGGLAGIVAAATALAPASELENVGYASRPGRMADQELSRDNIQAQAIQARIDATLPIVDDDDSSVATETNDRPMYRLPAIEEMSAPAKVEIPPITPLPEPTDETTEAEPPAMLPTITILPPVDTPPDMTIERAPADDADSQQSQQEEQTQYAPTITILPPVDLESESVNSEAEEPEPTAPAITILPPVDEPTVLPAEPTLPTEAAEQPAPAESATEITEETITEEFDTAWNEGNPPEPTTTSPATPTLPVMLPTIPPLVEEPTLPLAEPGPPIAEPLPPLEEAITIPQAQIAPQPQITPYSPTTAELSRQLLPTVQKAYRLAQQGAVYAAQAEFIKVLRRIAESKDSAEGTDTHSRALAAGLRAIDEADDFAPKGTELEADVNVAQIASAHRTPVLKSETPPAVPVRPAVAVALYHEFARAQLAAAVAGEQAGSMALHGLGKAHLRLARGADGQLQHERKALAMFAAALDAGPGNHLAANEIGVLLSRAGYPAEASAMFRHAIDLAPTSTTYHNLAVTDRALGYHEQAAANERYAFELAQRDRAASAASRSRGVAWVAPQELSRMAQPMPIEVQNQPQMASSPPQQMIQPVGGNAETASKWPKKLLPGSFWR